MREPKRGEHYLTLCLSNTSKHSSLGMPAWRWRETLLTREFQLKYSGVRRQFLDRAGAGLGLRGRPTPFYGDIPCSAERLKPRRPQYTLWYRINSSSPHLQETIQQSHPPVYNQARDLSSVPGSDLFLIYAKTEFRQKAARTPAAPSPRRHEKCSCALLQFSRGCCLYH